MRPSSSRNARRRSRRTTPKKDYKKRLKEHVRGLTALQRLHYASNRYALLLILQGMDAAGKDGAIRHVMSGINPQGCEMFSFKQPTAAELEHDFLRRTTRHLPERARIDAPDKNWKFSQSDTHERSYWAQYVQACEECINSTSTDHAPWYVVPADDKKNARLIVSQIVLDTLSGLHMAYPTTTEARHQELESFRAQL